MENIKLVICDIDGTIIPKGCHDISDNLKKAFKQLHEKGIDLLVATGRHYNFTQTKLFESLTNDYMITINGSCLNKINGEVVHYFTIDEDTLWNVVKVCETYDIGLGLKFKDNIVTYHNHEKYIEGYLPHNPEWREKIVNDCEKREYHLEHGLPCGIFFIGDENVIEELFHGRIGNLIVARSIKDGFDVFIEDINKSTGIDEYMKLTGHTWDEAICFGDAGNDTAMLKKAKIGVTFEDAKDFVKEACDYITCPCEEDGVYKALQHFGLIE